LAKYAEQSGIERIMVDLEILGKEERQGHLNTVFSKHTFDDVKNIRKVINKSKLLIRINPINENSKEEIDKAINLGADIIMLPMFKSKEEVEEFIKLVDGRVTTNLLLETSQALVRIDDMLEVDGIDEIHIGLNDLHLSMGLTFMFELLSGGIIEYLSKKIVSKNIKFGFGGVARIGQGTLDATLILSEHYRLNSSMVILSRDFKGYVESYEEIIEKINLKNEVEKINNYISELDDISDEELMKNRFELKMKINIILRNMKRS
jgi:hypothetical protein